jgi:hypothetical protein
VRKQLSAAWLRTTNSITNIRYSASRAYLCAGDFHSGWLLEKLGYLYDMKEIVVVHDKLAVFDLEKEMTFYPS